MEEYALKSAQVNQKYLCVSDHGMMGVIPRQIRAAEENDLTPVLACLLKGQPIYCKDGIRDIDQIKVGDYVLTHKGKYKRVLATMSRDFSGKVYEIRLGGGVKGKTLSLTEGHPVLIRNKDGNISWVNAEDIIGGSTAVNGNPCGINRHNSYVCFPKTQNKNKNVKIRCNEYLGKDFAFSNGHVVSLKSNKTWIGIEKEIDITEDFSYFLGLFAAEGSFHKKGNKLSGGMVISLNANEENLFKKVSVILAKYGIKTSNHVRLSKMDVTFCCVPLANILSCIIGSGAKNKKIPAEIFESSLEIQKCFLCGLLDGDGKNPHRDTNKGKQQTLRISSKTLAWQTKLLLANQGHWVNVFERKEKATHRNLVKTVYYLPISLFGKYKRSLEDEKYIYKPIRDISSSNEKVKVYNIEVEDHNSYVSDFALHNCELYLNDLHPEKDVFENMSGADKKNLIDANGLSLRKSYHLLAIAYNNKGYSNLVNLCTWGWLNGYYYRPRVTYEQINKHKEGIIFTSCCYNSEIGQTFEYRGKDAAMDMVKEYLEMFGENFYLELMLLDFTKQKPYDKFIIEAHEKFHIPLILTNDCHYCNEEDSKYQRYMLMIQKETTIQEIEKKLSSEDRMDIFELQDASLWMKSEEELNDKWASMYSDVIPEDLFIQAKLNTVKICEKARGVEIDRNIKLPQIPDAEDKFKEALIQGFKWRGLNGKDYISRLKEEYELICRKGFSSYFLIQKKMTDEARRISPKLLGWGTGDESIGPGRGCLSGDTLVVMPNGTSKRLDAIKKGDSVITIDGSCKEVKETMIYPVEEELLKIKTYYGDFSGVTLTKDHKILCEKYKSSSKPEWSDSTNSSRKRVVEPVGELSWLRADQLVKGDWVFIPTPVVDEVKDYNIDLSIFENGNDITIDEKSIHDIWFQGNSRHARRIKTRGRMFELTDDWFTALGVFAGNGWLRSNDRNVVGFCFNPKTDNHIDFIKNLLKENDFRYYEKYHKNKSLLQITVNDKILERLFAYLHPRYKYKPQTKHVPELVIRSSRNKILNYLKGYGFADGHHGTHKFSFSTVSRELADQVRHLCWRVGIPASVLLDDREEPREEFKNSGISYIINIPHHKDVTGRDSKNAYVYRKVSGGLLTRILSIEAMENIKHVYDISIKDNHNYLTTSCLVHNSAVGSLACFCLGITDVDPIRHGLLFSRFLSENRGGKSMKLRFGKK